MFEKLNIIAGGNSVKDMDCPTICNRAYTIGVNSAAIHAPVDLGISMDRHWMTHFDYAIRGKRFLLRRIVSRWPSLFQFGCDHETDEFTNVPGRLNGRSSGHCALNLALQIKPKKLFLFGYDFTGKAYWYGPYPWSKKADSTRIDGNWIKAAERGIEQLKAAGIEVYIVGETKITNAIKLTYQEYLNATKKTG